MLVVHNPNPDATPNVLKPLYQYLGKDIIHNAEYCKVTKMYQSIDRGSFKTFYGLNSWLKKQYYPYYTHSKRRYSKKNTYKINASSSARGKRVDRELGYYLYDQTPAGKKKRKRNGKRKRNRDPLTAGILQYWVLKGHTLVATQIPVHLKHIDRMTEADAITIDAQGAFHMWEVKTCGVGLKQVKGLFNAPYDTVKCTMPNQWQLQRHYTHQGLVQGGLPLASSRVLHATETRGKTIKVCALPNPDWLNM